MIELPNVDTLDESNLVNAVKKVILAHKEQSEILQNLLRTGDVKLHAEVRGLKEEIKGLRGDINDLGQDISSDLDQQTQTVSEKLEEIHITLQTIAKNTAPGSS